MIQKVAKRPDKEGAVRLVDFDPGKIASAIYKAAYAVGGRDFSEATNVTTTVVDRLNAFGREVITIEEIQDQVEKALVDHGHYKTVRAYIVYREQHTKMRTAEVIKSGIHIKEYLRRNDMAVKENANITYSLQGLNVHVVDEAMKAFWLDEVYPAHIKTACLAGDFHIHDLGTLAAYCVGWDLRDLLINGFNGVKGKVASGPAKHFRTALGQAINYLYTLQGEAAGAQAFSNFDTLLAPFIFFDRLSYNQVKQGLQEFVFNMNVPTRVGFQTPFTNVTMDLKVPEFMKNEPAIYGGQLMEMTYGEFQKEMDMFNRAFAEVMMEGDVEERVFTFPIPTYNITDEFDWDNPEYDAIWEMTAKYGIPYFSNFIGSDMNPEDARSMCCRLRLDNRELQKRPGGLFASSPLTGSVGVVTINLPRIGFVSQTEEEFYLRLGMVMDIAKDSLEIKRKTVENWTAEGLYPYTAHHLRGVKAQSGKYWNNHFSTIGLVGMHECCLNFLGKGIQHPEGKAFAEDVMDFMLKRIACYQEKTGNLYNLESTPAEGAAAKLALIDLQKFPGIITSGTTEAAYYTNSTQLPVGYTDDLYEALDHQQDLQTKYTGGTVFHIFLGERAPSSESTKKLVRKVCESFTLPYFTITPTFSVCPEDGYLDGEKHDCPICGSECEVYSRVVGYIRPISQFNRSQQLQASLRGTFDRAIGRPAVLELS